MKESFTQKEFIKEKLKLNKNMHLYDMCWEIDNKKVEVGFKMNYVDRIDYMRQELDSLLYYKIISIDKSTGKVIWNNHNFYLFGYDDLWYLCGEEKILYCILNRLYIEDINGDQEERYLKSLEYYND
jgi:hypothetical protein